VVQQWWFQRFVAEVVVPEVYWVAEVVVPEVYWVAVPSSGGSRGLLGNPKALTMKTMG
jgi:hypothetical protein